MAYAHTLKLQLEYENNVGFQMQSQLDGGTIEVAAKLDENTHFGTVWPHIKTACDAYFTKILENIGTELEQA